MIRVIVELLPGGYSALRRSLATMHIANISNLARRSDYRVDIDEGKNTLTGAGPRSCTVWVRDHDRHQSVWRLIGAALSEADRLAQPDD